MASNQLPIIEMIASALGGGGMLKFADWLNSRQKTRAYTMGAVDHAVETALKAVTDRLQVVEAQHAHCDAELREVKDRLDGSERDRRELKLHIDRLMSGEVPGYGPHGTGGWGGPSV